MLELTPEVLAGIASTHGYGNAPVPSAAAPLAAAAAAALLGAVVLAHGRAWQARRLG